jgi:uncharacterized protein (DUF433 family)
MGSADRYVRTDEHGVMRVADTRVMLDSVIAGYKQGHSPETIRQQYPALTLEQVYGAITYYLAHQAQVDDYLRRQDALWQRLRREAESRPAPVVKRLRALRRKAAAKME